MTPRDRIRFTLELLETLWPNHDGPAHIVVADGNLETRHIQWCIDQIDRGETYTLGPDRSDPNHPVHAATKALLAYLLLVVDEKDRERYFA